MTTGGLAAYARGVHPIERLRYVARAGAVPVAPLVRESAAALASFAEDHNGLFLSCRRLLDRRGDCGPLIWLAARMLRALDARAEAFEVVAALDCDPIGWVLQDAFDELPSGSRVLACADSEFVDDALGLRPDLRVVGESENVEPNDRGLRPDLRVFEPDEPDVAADADLVVLSSDCAGASGALVAPAAVPFAEAAREYATPVWMVVGAGRQLPESMWRALSGRLDADTLSRRSLAVLDLHQFVTQVVTGAGLRTSAQAARESDCPEALELFTR